MAKSPDRPAKSTHKTVTGAAEKPKPAKAAASKPKVSKSVAAETIKIPTKVKKSPSPAKASKAATPKAKSKSKSVIEQTSDTISKLASDILADRIIPTIEQIKAVAASALGQDETAGKKKRKKK